MTGGGPCVVIDKGLKFVCNISLESTAVKYSWPYVVVTCSARNGTDKTERVKDRVPESNSSTTIFIG